jgi:hypothetical protein
VIDLSKEKFCIWGFKNGRLNTNSGPIVDRYDPFMHIHAAWYRTLTALGKQVLWLDSRDDTRSIDFSNTFFITQNHIVRREWGVMPLRKDCFYAVHNSIQEGKEAFAELDVLPFGVQLYGSPTVEVEGSINFPWATDLLPHEIERNKPAFPFRSHSHRVTYVGGTGDAGDEIRTFGRACRANNIMFDVVGGGVSIEENVRLIQESYMAPALVGRTHPKGYLPCRIFKNISYGQYGVTNSPWVYDLFEGRVIYNQDVRALFHQARTELPSITTKQLYDVMDYVARNHTYLNRFDLLMEAAEQKLGISG